MRNLRELDRHYKHIALFAGILISAILLSVVFGLLGFLMVLGATVFFYRRNPLAPLPFGLDKAHIVEALTAAAMIALAVGIARTPAADTTGDPIGKKKSPPKKPIHRQQERTVSPGTPATSTATATETAAAEAQPSGMSATFRAQGLDRSRTTLRKSLSGSARPRESATPATTVAIGSAAAPAGTKQKPQNTVAASWQNTKQKKPVDKDSVKEESEQKASKDSDKEESERESSEKDDKEDKDDEPRDNDGKKGKKGKKHTAKDEDEDD